jgi:hypothetical protein
VIEEFSPETTEKNQKAGPVRGRPFGIGDFLVVFLFNLCALGGELCFWMGQVMKSAAVSTCQ